MRYFLFALISCVAFSGCMLGPKGSLPSAELQATFREENGTVTENEPHNQWWKIFNDAQLDQCISEALKDSFSIRVAIEKVKEIRGSFHMESADLWPSLNAFGSYLRLKKPENLLGFPAVGNPVQNVFALGFDASWELDLFGKVRSAKKAAYFDVLSSEENVRDAQVTISSEVARLYTEIRTYQQRVHVLKQQIKTEQKLLKLAKSLNQTGLSSQQDILRAHADLLQSQSILPRLQGSLKSSIYHLTFLLGKKPGDINSLFALRKPIPIADQKVPVGLPSDLLRRRPDIRAAERNYFSACAKIGQAKADLFPSISLTGVFAGISPKSNNIFTQAAKTWLIWPTINWNIFQGWKTLANIKVQKSKQKQALINYESAISQSLRDVEVALCAYSEEGLSLQDLKEDVIVKRRICALSQTLFLSGLEQEKKVLLAQRDLCKSKDAYFQSKEKYMLHLIALYKALGGGWSYEYGVDKNTP